jgi:hypothetical protein
LEYKQKKEVLERDKDKYNSQNVYANHIDKINGYRRGIPLTKGIRREGGSLGCVDDTKGNVKS